MASVQYEEPITILSDLHFGHQATEIDAPEQLVPVFEESKTVIFNGDTVEMRTERFWNQGRKDLLRIADTCRAAGTEPVFVNGNHDPDISEFNHIDMAGGAVLVTHGDILFHDISPWSSEAAVMGPEHSRILGELEKDELEDFEHRLSASKRVMMSVSLPDRLKPRDGRQRFLATLLYELWPPWKPFQILGVWLRTPHTAVRMAETFRPAAKYIVIGHTHFGGIWELASRTVINTGSFLPVFGRTAVQLERDVLSVRRIDREEGCYRLGACVREFPLQKLDR